MEGTTRFTFKLKNGRAGRLAALTAAIEDGDIEQGVTGEVERQLESRLQAECACCGVPRLGDVHTEIQANLTGGIDVTLTALVRSGKRVSKRKQPMSMPAATAREA
jgi:hypothetical protein